MKSERYKGLLPEDLMDLMIGDGLYFNPATETGVLFHMIGALSQFGKLGVICIADSAQGAEELYQRTRDVLDMETNADRADRGEMHSMFDDFPHLMD